MLSSMFDEQEDGSTAVPPKSAGSSSLSDTRPPSGFVGLDNQGATCYLNTLLQAMYMTPELRHGLYAVDPATLGSESHDREDRAEAEKEKQLELRRAALAEQANAKGQLAPDEDMVRALQEMGYGEHGCRRAVLATKNAGLEQAMDWIFQHDQDHDFNVPVKGFAEDTRALALIEEEAKKKEKAKGKGKIKAQRVSLELQRLFARLQLLNTASVSTEDLTRKGFRWKDTEETRAQHDIHELNRLLIERLEVDLSGSTGSKLVPTLYKGSLVNQIRCRTCETISNRAEPFYDLFLQVKENEATDLVDALAAYTAPEALEKQEQYFCDKCNSKQDADRRVLLKDLPPVLFFSINRFLFDGALQQRVKVTSRFEFPLSVDMTPFLESGAPPLGGVDVGDQNVKNDYGHVWLGEAKERATEAAESVLSGKDPREAASEQKEERDKKCLKGDPMNCYDVFAAVIHRGSAYSGHYHALIKDCLSEGCWRSPERPDVPEENDAAQSTSPPVAGSVDNAHVLHDADIERSSTPEVSAAKKALEGAPVDPWRGLPTLPLEELARKAAGESLKDGDGGFKRCLSSNSADFRLAGELGDDPDDKAEKVSARVEEKGSASGFGPDLGRGLVGTPAGDKASGAGSDSKALAAAAADEYMSTVHGHWFNFDDRNVTPVSVAELAKTFEGKDSAYLLIYRARWLKDDAHLANIKHKALEPDAPTITANGDNGALVENSSKISPGDSKTDVNASETLSAAALLEKIEMRTYPPEHWALKTEEEAAVLDRARSGNELSASTVEIGLWFPVQLGWEYPHLKPLSGSKAMMVKVDGRMPMADLKNKLIELFLDQFATLGVPENADDVILTQLKEHKAGGGFYLHQHLDCSKERPGAVPTPIRGLRWRIEGDPIMIWGGRLQPNGPHYEEMGVGSHAKAVDLNVTLLGKKEGEPVSMLQFKLSVQQGLSAADLRGKIVPYVAHNANIDVSGLLISLIQPRQRKRQHKTHANGQHTKEGAPDGDDFDVGAVEVLYVCPPTQDASEQNSFQGGGKSKQSKARGKQQPVHDVRGQGWGEGPGFDISDGCELLVEECVGGMDAAMSVTSHPLAEAEAQRRNRHVTFQVEVSHLPHNMADSLDKCFRHGMLYHLLNFTIERHINVGWLKYLCLERLYPNRMNDQGFKTSLLALAEDAKIRLRDGSKKWLTNEDESLYDIGLHNHKTMELYIDAASSTSAAEGGDFKIKYALMRDQSGGQPRSEKSQSSALVKVIESAVTANPTSTVIAVKNLMINDAYAKGYIKPAERDANLWHLRGTNWLSEPAAIIVERAYQEKDTSEVGVKDGAKSKTSDPGVPVSVDTLLKESSILECEGGVILEEGRFLAVGEVEVNLYMWTPSEEEVKKALVTGDDGNEKVKVPAPSLQDLPRPPSTSPPPPPTYDDLLAKRDVSLRPLKTVCLYKTCDVEKLEEAAVQAIDEQLVKDWEAAVSKVKTKRRKKVSSQYKTLWSACKGTEKANLFTFLRENPTIDVNAIDANNSNNTALHMAALCGNAGNSGATLCALKKEELDFTIRNKEGKTVLDILDGYVDPPASTQKEFDMFKALVKKFTEAQKDVPLKPKVEEPIPVPHTFKEAIEAGSSFRDLIALRGRRPDNLPGRLIREKKLIERAAGGASTLGMAGYIPAPDPDVPFLREEEYSNTVVPSHTKEVAKKKENQKRLQAKLDQKQKESREKMLKMAEAPAPAVEKPPLECTLENANLLGQQHVVVCLTSTPIVRKDGDAPPVYLWVYQRKNPTIKNVPHKMVPDWPGPPREVIVSGEGGGLPISFLDVRSAIGDAFGLSWDRVRPFKLHRSKFFWVDLSNPSKASASAAADKKGKGGGAKKQKGAAGSEGGGGGSKRGGGLRDAPINLVSGDVIIFIDTSEDPRKSVTEEDISPPEFAAEIAAEKERIEKKRASGGVDSGKGRGQNNTYQKGAGNDNDSSSKGNAKRSVERQLRLGGWDTESEEDSD